MGLDDFPDLRTRDGMIILELSGYDVDSEIAYRLSCEGSARGGEATASKWQRNEGAEMPRRREFEGAPGQAPRPAPGQAPAGEKSRAESREEEASGAESSEAWEGEDEDGAADPGPVSPPGSRSDPPENHQIEQLRRSFSPERNDQLEDRVSAFGREALPELERVATNVRELPHVRGAALRAAQDIDVQSLRDLLLLLVRDPEALVREAAVEGLVELRGDGGIARVLEEISRSDPSEVIRAAAADIRRNDERLLP